MTPEQLAELRTEAESGSGRQRRPRKDLWIKLLDMAERCADYDRRLSEVMPADFKDWHDNGPKEWPEVAAGTIKRLRERLEQAEGKAADYHGKLFEALRALDGGAEAIG